MYNWDIRNFFERRFSLNSVNIWWKSVTKYPKKIAFPDGSFLSGSPQIISNTEESSEHLREIIFSYMKNRCLRKKNYLKIKKR